MMELKMELKLTSPSSFSTDIKFNKTELIAELKSRLSAYEGKYADTEISLAKSDKEALNRLRNAIDARRKDIKREILEPYLKFEAEVKEVLAIIDKPIADIDAQIKYYREKKENLAQKAMDMYSPPLYELKFKARATKEKLELLKKFLKEEKIEVEELK